MSCSLYQIYRRQENRRPDALLFRGSSHTLRSTWNMTNSEFTCLFQFWGRLIEMRERGRGREEIKCYVTDLIKETPSVCSSIGISHHSKYGRNPGEAMPALHAFTYSFIQTASKGRGRVRVNQRHLKPPTLILFYIYTLVTFIKDDQWLVTTKSYWFAAQYYLLSIWHYFLLTRELHCLQL